MRRGAANAAGPLRSITRFSAVGSRAGQDDALVRRGDGPLARGGLEGVGVHVLAHPKHDDDALGLVEVAAGRELLHLRQGNAGGLLERLLIESGAFELGPEGTAEHGRHVFHNDDERAVVGQIGRRVRRSRPEPRQPPTRRPCRRQGDQQQRSDGPAHPRAAAGRANRPCGSGDRRRRRPAIARRSERDLKDRSAGGAFGPALFGLHGEGQLCVALGTDDDVHGRLPVCVPR